ncbi:MAG: o-succinylbenzoate synthase [Elainellaceae cyanobacterium]
MRFQFRPYHRPFNKPLQTHHGLWSARDGFVVRLEDENGRAGWGEIAPLEAFGSENLEQACKFCQNLPDKITPEQIWQIPESLPACQFGFESAWEMMQTQNLPCSGSGYESLLCSYLLPTGKPALEAWQAAWKAGYRTFKWKIGVAPCAQELELLEQLVTELPVGARLRLDANGGLDWDTACQWLKCCDRPSIAPKVEFLEQPLAAKQFDQMYKLSQQFQTPIALDESVSSIADLIACYRGGWRSIFVIKAAIAGSPRQLREFCQGHALDVVWSSVFETAIARRYIEQYLIPVCSATKRAIGFGVDQWFQPDCLMQSDFEQLWQSL